LRPGLPFTVSDDSRRRYAPFGTSEYHIMGAIIIVEDNAVKR